MEFLAHINPDEDRCAYKNLLESELKDHICPLCPEGLKRTDNNFFKKKAGWTVLANAFPYDHTRVHVLIIPQKHKVDLNELTAKDMQTVGELAQWCQKKFKIKGGALAVRFGDHHYSGASVHHLHFHMISPQHLPHEDMHPVINFGVGTKD